jgi:hypothetical protein
MAIMRESTSIPGDIGVSEDLSCIGNQSAAIEQLGNPSSIPRAPALRVWPGKILSVSKESRKPLS